MKLSHISRGLKGGKDSLIAVLTSKASVKQVNAFVLTHLEVDLRLGMDAGDSGATNVYTTPELRIVVLGIGDREGLEDYRRAVCNAVNRCNDAKLKRLAIACVTDKSEQPDVVTALAEAAALANYQFLPYKSEPRKHSLEEVNIYATGRGAAEAVKRGVHFAAATNLTRDLVNEPVITLTATEFGKRAEAVGKKACFAVEVLNNAKIQALKMGGLLGVNAGSPEPPAFIVMEYKPKGARNKQPVVLVGKGVVFDTGGLSPKETPGSMDYMKSDMAGGAAVIGALMGAANLELPVHVVGLVPATDNRPGGNAVTPGDILKMMDGTTVEVLNTDAEGRLILADALAYAKKYKPSLVIDLATLTGAAVIAVGHQASCMMSTADSLTRKALADAGDHVHERVVEFPLFEEYADLLKSDIADLKNIGGKTAGAITAAKFLEHFTDYPWIHLDIAGPSFLHSTDSYRGRNATGTGTRLLLQFLSNYK